MNLVRYAAVWTGKHFAALALICAILLLGKYGWEPGKAWVNAQVEDANAVPAKRASLSRARVKSERSIRSIEKVEQEYKLFIAERGGTFKNQATKLSMQPKIALQQRLKEIEPAIVEQKKLRLGQAQLTWAVANGDSTKVSAHFRAGAEIALLNREKLYIDRLIKASLVNVRKWENFKTKRKSAVKKRNKIVGDIRSAETKQRRLRDVRFAKQRNIACSLMASAPGCQLYRDLKAAETAEENARKELRDIKKEIENIDTGKRKFKQAVASTVNVLNDLNTYRDEMSNRADSLRKEQVKLNNEFNAFEDAASKNWVLWIEKPLLETLPTALMILLGAIFSPIIFKLVLYFAIAPFAARRKPIQLLPEESGAVTVGSAAFSAVSQRVTLQSSDELLILPDFLQSSPHDAPKSDKWLLSWAMPFSSLASGLVGLVRLRSNSGDYVSISATRDPLAEVGLVRIADGSAMALQPRSLLGLIQPINQPMRITKHWKLDHLSAWLTFQFRYLVFHGPCTLIIQGSRGVVLEKAGFGRGINQAATIGFSAGVEYSVRRCETFGPYLMGKQGLFHDSFVGDQGAYVYEEMPRDGQKSGIWGRGLEGLSDAVLKVFGL